ncbi:hypothetical protein ACC862_24040 [Rhizobium ruizarguesonis]
MADTEFKTALVGSWTKVSDDLQNVFISHDRTDPVHVYIGAPDPDANSAFHRCTADRPFSMSGVSGKDIFVRSGGTSSIQVTVTAV